MEKSWGKEAMKFARREIPALLNTYKGKPEGFFSALDKAWKDYCKLLKKRMAELPKDDESDEEAPDAPADSGSAGGDTGDGK